MRGSILAAAVLIASTGAIAAAPQEQAAPETAQQEKKVCRIDRATGSLTRRTRLCLTRAQWQQLHSRTKRGLDDFVGAASGGCRAPDNAQQGTMC